MPVELMFARVTMDRCLQPATRLSGGNYCSVRPKIDILQFIYTSMLNNRTPIGYVVHSMWFRTQPTTPLCWLCHQQRFWQSKIAKDLLIPASQNCGFVVFLLFYIRGDCNFWHLCFGLIFQPRRLPFVPLALGNCNRHFSLFSFRE